MFIVFPDGSAQLLGLFVSQDTGVVIAVPEKIQELIDRSIE